MRIKIALSNRYLVDLMVAILILSAFVMMLSPTPSKNIANVRFIKAVNQNQPASLPGASEFLIGMHAVRQGDNLTAIKFLQKADPQGNILARYYLAKAMSQSSDWPGAIPLLHPDNPYEEQLLKEILIKNLDHEGAVVDEEWIEWTQTNYPSFFPIYADHLIQNQDYQRAKGWSESAPDFKRSTQLLNLGGKANFYLGNLSAAMELFRAAHELSATGDNAYWYGRTLMLNGDPLTAITFLKDAVQKAANDELSAWYLLDLGMGYAETGLCREAAAALDDSIHLNPNQTGTERYEAVWNQVLAKCSVH